MAGCSGGIEPMYSLAFYRNVLKEAAGHSTPMIEVNSIFEEVANERGFLSEGLMDQIAKDGTLADIDGIPDDVKSVFVCAHDISPEWHVRMQAAFQHHCDASISKTINFPHEAAAEDVDQIYRRAYELRCKGITVYRNGCREAQPMALKDDEKSKANSSSDATDASKEGQNMQNSLDIPMLEPRDIPEIVSGLRLRQMTPFGNMHVKLTVDPKSERELEVFAQLGKGGDIATSDLEAICRMISLWLRSGGALKHVIRQLKDIGSSLQVPTKHGKIMSLGDGLARALQRYLRAKERFGLRNLLLGDFDMAELDRPARAPGNGNGNGKSKGHGNASEVRQTSTSHGSSGTGMPMATGTMGTPRVDRLAFKVKCPECGEALVFAEGCNKCPGCGWAQC
jgi:ribonucleoside-diphosphate reductase alpha chain